jgi:hypothetical protein
MLPFKQYLIFTRQQLRGNFITPLLRSSRSQLINVLRIKTLIRDLIKQAGRQRDDGGQNHLVKISYCKESLSCIIYRINVNKLQYVASVGSG